MESKILTDEEIKKIDSEIAKKQAEALNEKAREQAVEIESRVRKEMEAKLEADKLKEQFNKQAEDLKKYKEEQESKMKAQEEAFKKQLEDALAVRKGPAKNESPFQDNANLRTLSDGTQIDVSKLDMDRVEEESRIAFVQMHHLPSDFGKPMVRYK